MSSITLYRLSGYALLVGSSLASLFEFIRMAFLLIGLVGFGVTLMASPWASKTEQSSLATTEDRSTSASG